MKKYKIADFVIEYLGNERYMDERFDDFSCSDDEKTDMTLRIVEKEPLFPRFLWNKGTRIGIFHYYEDNGKMYQFFPYQHYVGVKLVEIKNNFSDVTYYLCKGSNAEANTEMIQGIIFNLFQETFFNMLL